MNYAIVITQGEKSFGAHVPDLPGCVAMAKSYAKVMQLIREAIDEHLRILREEGKPEPMPNTTTANVDTHLDHWKKREPWVAVDPDFKREWLLPDALRYFLVHDKKADTWSVCDRWFDIPVFLPDSKTRRAAIQRFYKSFGRSMPMSEKVSELPLARQKKSVR